MSLFTDFKLNKQLLQAVADKGYLQATPVQGQAIPRVLAGQDLVAVAQTGTGKTAAYLLPLLMKIKYAQGDHPRGLIVAPTRELSVQIADELQALATYTDIRFACVFGGKGLKRQVEQVQKGVDILIGTPARLMDVYLQAGIMLRQVQIMVLDEADKMMDMGFFPQIKRLLEVVPAKRQNLLFSATFPEKVAKLSEEFLDFPDFIEITPQSTPAETVAQQVYHVPNFRAKIDLLQHLLGSTEDFARVMVFVRTRQNANNIHKFLARKVEGEVRVLHANKDQNTRLNAINEFKQGNIRVLVATDVLSRGIDVTMVSHVINFDVPLVYEDYVHRIGRTGRATHTGMAVTFCNPAEKYHLQKIEKLIKMKIEGRALPAEVPVTETPFQERQEILREIDQQRQKEDPAFKGAFHEKKKKKERGTGSRPSARKPARGKGRHHRKK